MIVRMMRWVFLINAVVVALIFSLSHGLADTFRIALIGIECGVAAGMISAVSTIFSKNDVAKYIDNWHSAVFSFLIIPAIIVVCGVAYLYLGDTFHVNLHHRYRQVEFLALFTLTGVVLHVAVIYVYIRRDGVRHL
ncbi:MAG TPA: hypothetical protein VHV83_02510 [Armatimonadota bacterium]|nr:hypothetical protein [Armatimonadota bacterium]